MDNGLIHNVLNNNPEDVYGDDLGVGDNLDFIHGIMVITRQLRDNKHCILYHIVSII